MPESVYGIQSARRFVSDAPLSHVSGQEGLYWSGGTGVATTPLVLPKAPRGTCIAAFGADPGHYGSAYTVSHTGYLWKQVGWFTVNSQDYPVVGIYIGQPRGPDVVTGTTVTFTHNGNNGFRTGVLVEMNRTIKGEIVDLQTGYSSGSTGVNSLSVSREVVIREKNLVMVGAASFRSGGAGVNNASVFLPRGYQVPQALLSFTYGFPNKGTRWADLVTPIWFTASRSDRWGAIWAVIR